MQVKSLFAHLSALGMAQAATIGSRAVVAHDSLFPVAENVQTGAVGDVIKKFEPRLHVAHGCQVYTAVDNDGNTSGGLQDTGSSTGGCRHTDRGQTYVRSTTHNGRLAIMYSWYWPKDMPTGGVSTGAHRHDWENVVVFVDSAEGGNLVSAAASGHGEYKKTTTPQMEGTSPKVEYFTSFPTNHELQFSDTVGWEFAMIDWDVMTQAMKDALSNTDFGSANVPFKDANFVSNLDKAAS